MRLLVSVLAATALIIASAASAEPVTIDCSMGTIVRLKATFNDGGSISVGAKLLKVGAFCNDSQGDIYTLDLDWGAGNPQFGSLAGAEAFVRALRAYGDSAPTVEDKPES